MAAPAWIRTRPPHRAPSGRTMGGRNLRPALRSIRTCSPSRAPAHTTARRSGREPLDELGSRVRGHGRTYSAFLAVSSLYCWPPPRSAPRSSPSTSARQAYSWRNTRPEVLTIGGSWIIWATSTLERRIGPRWQRGPGLRPRSPGTSGEAARRRTSSPRRSDGNCATWSKRRAENPGRHGSRGRGRGAAANCPRPLRSMWRTSATLRPGSTRPFRSTQSADAGGYSRANTKRCCSSVGCAVRGSDPPGASSSIGCGRQNCTSSLQPSEPDAVRPRNTVHREIVEVRPPPDQAARPY